MVDLKNRLLFRFAKKWIADREMGGAIMAAKEANSEGKSVLLNRLGEDITDFDLTQKHFNEYLALEDSINQNDIKGCVSIKLTQLGLLLDQNLVRARVEKLAGKAEALGQLFWIDMEGSALTSKTLKLYADIFKRHKNAGVAIQAYLRRSEDDLDELLEMGGRIRLVKGAYSEPHRLVYPDRREIAENYSKLMKILFERGEHFTIATHDSKLIDAAKRLSVSHRVDFQFAMLRGIRDDLKLKLINSGYQVSDYLPFGDEWYSYAVRRIREHPSNMLLLARSLI